MKVSALTYAIVLPLILFSLVPIGGGSARQVSNEYPNPKAVGSAEDPALAVKALLTQTGTPFSSKAGRFRITLPPGFPTFQHKQRTQTTAVGDIELHTFLAEVSQGVCIVGYSDFPPKSFEGRSAQQRLEGGRDGAMGSLKATIERQESSMLQGHPTLTVTGKGGTDEKPLFVRFKFVLAQPRAYQIGYLSYDRTSLDTPETLAFFKSFRLDD